MRVHLNQQYFSDNRHATIGEPIGQGLYQFNQIFRNDKSYVGSLTNFFKLQAIFTRKFDINYDDDLLYHKYDINFGLLGAFLVDKNKPHSVCNVHDVNQW